MTTIGQMITSLICGIIAFWCLIWTFYHSETFLDNIFGNLLILAAGVICGIIACAEAGIMGSEGGT